MTPQMQSLLLRFLDNGEIQPVGSSHRSTRADVRVITATNRRLIDRVQTNDFREDLFYRLNVIYIDIPPLRERREDVPLLLDYFLTKYAASNHVERPRMSEDALNVLQAFDWPGNVRQLRNVAERVVVRLKPGQEVMPIDLPREILSGWLPSSKPTEAPPSRTRTDLMFERLVEGRESFWTVVYEPFMDRDITRDDLRALIAHGLELTNGSQSDLLGLFNVEPGDARRFTGVLRKYQCQPEPHVRHSEAPLDT